MDRSLEPIAINLGYVQWQLAKAFVAQEPSLSSEARRRGRERVTRWVNVLQGIQDGRLTIGSRTPVAQTPEWVTLEVVKGGFATGSFLAGGDLQDHERSWAKELNLPQSLDDADVRRSLNLWFLTDDGLGRLRDMTDSTCYDVRVPEEGALLAVACLLRLGQLDAANEVLEAIIPFMDRLRFYPVPTDRPVTVGSRVFVQSVGKTKDKLQRRGTPHQIAAFREAVLVWRPMWDRLVALFLETVEGELPGLSSSNGRVEIAGGWPCQIQPEDWKDRLQQWLVEFDRLSRDHRLTKKPRRSKEHFAKLAEFAKRFHRSPQTVARRDIGMVRMILAHYVAKHGRPDSERCQSLRQQQLAIAQLPLHKDIAQVLKQRLQGFDDREGLDDPQAIAFDVTAEEANLAPIPVGTGLPRALLKTIQRCLCDTVDVLVERGLITSGEVLARLLPQVTAQHRSAGFGDEELQIVSAAVYRAFRRRRSLLLLNLESQVRITELPWIAVLERLRRETATTQEASRSALREITALTLSAFPHAIIPNKLLQEMRALAESAQLNLPLVDELAADIFMGDLSDKFTAAAKIAAEQLEGSLYARAYDINFAAIRSLPSPAEQRSFLAVLRRSVVPTTTLVEICATRAGVPIRGRVATNGMVIEQQQILTTQNLAVLVVKLDLQTRLQPELPRMSRECLEWILKTLNLKTSDRHSRLIHLKNSAYAWRQLVYFLSLQSDQEVFAFLNFATDRLQATPEAFRTKFQPMLQGLMLAVSGMSLSSGTVQPQNASQFLGWSNGTHPLA